MTFKDFNKSIEQQLEFSKKLMLKKGNEYAKKAGEFPQGDRLAHFKKAASLQSVSQKQAIFGMLAKHIISISDMVASEETYSADLWQEKITDSINYLLILKAAVDEETNNIGGNK